MIHTAKQLKDKVRNISKGDNNIAKVLIRNFIMERFLERVSCMKRCYFAKCRLVEEHYIIEIDKYIEN